MKNSLLKKVLATIVAVILVVGISAGTSILVDKKSVPASTTIENGLSAYDLAVQNGYKGDLEQWLMSLVGETGTAGSNGKSAYELACENGYKGTMTEW